MNACIFSDYVNTRLCPNDIWILLCVVLFMFALMALTIYYASIKYDREQDGKSDAR